MVIRFSTVLSASICMALALTGPGHAEAQQRVAKSTGGAAAKHTLDPAIQVAQSSLKSISEVKDYQAFFNKRELVGNKMIVHSMLIKMRHDPFSVYLRFSGEEDGREVIYVDGQNDGELLVHETGITSLVGTVSVNPTGSRALSESRYPITRIGMKNLVGSVLEQWKSDRQFDDVELKYFPKAKLGQVECKVIQTSHPTPRNGAQFQMTRLFIDRESNLPVRIEQYAFPSQPGGKPMLVEEYTYSGIRTDIGLKDIDFDTRNPAYGY